MFKFKIGKSISYFEVGSCSKIGLLHEVVAIRVLD